jgi:hypothetical protein
MTRQEQVKHRYWNKRQRNVEQREKMAVLEQEIRADERQKCIKEACCICGGYSDALELIARRTKDGRWVHFWEDEEIASVPHDCDAWKTHERVWQEGLKNG